MKVIKNILKTCNRAARGEVSNADALAEIDALARNFLLAKLNARADQLKASLTEQGVDVDELFRRLENN